jgi:hypothetical protein
MKIITANKPWNIDQLAKTLNEKLNILFQQARHVPIHFNVVKYGETIEINQPELYEGFLFKISANGNNLCVAKSEHYVDDINVITLMGILDNLRMDHLDGADIVYISGE